MEKAEVCRLSAKALEKPPAILEMWDPFSNAYQRWECVEWLLLQGRVILLDPDNRHQSWGLSRLREPTIQLTCPVSEVPGRLAAEVQRLREQS